MSRRRLLLVAMLAALVLGGIGVWMFADANARVIRPGMTSEEVESRLGEPTIRKYSGGVAVFSWDNGVAVAVDDDGVVTEVIERSLMERVRRLLGL